MTIEKGKEWGSRINTPAVVTEVLSDSELVSEWLKQPDAFFVVRGGDLFHSLGKPMCDVRSPHMQLLSVDILSVELVVKNVDESNTASIYHAVSSVEIGQWRSRRRYVCISNCGFVNGRNVAPRAHPNDGEMDVLTVAANMPWRQRYQAHQRTQLGTHLPHPQLSMERGTEGRWTREDTREVLRCDGVKIEDTSKRQWDSVLVTVIPDACQVLV